jgi:sorting nexin-29
LAGTRAQSCTTYKILANILFVKLRPYAEEIIGEYDGGSRRGISTADQIFTVRQILEKYWEQNIDVHQLFIDFQAAYDTVWRMEIWSQMHTLSFPKN